MRSRSDASRLRFADGSNRNGNNFRYWQARAPENHPVSKMQTPIRIRTMYGKIYEQTFTGSMAGTGSDVFALWSYVIAHTKPDSMVEINPMIVGAQIGTPIDRIEKAIEYLCSPDARSRSKTYNGCRLIRKGEYIYFVPQSAKYRGLANNQARRQYWAEKQRERRQRLKECQTGMSKMSTSVNECQTIRYSTQYSESEEEEPSLTLPKGREASKARPSSCQEVEDFCLTLSLPHSDGEAMWLKWQAKGYGKIKDWKATIRQWKAFGYLPSQKQSRNGHKTSKLPAPTYPKLPPSREVSDEELAAQRKIVREASAKLKEELGK